MAELIVIHLQDHQNKRALSCSSFWWDKFYIYCTELYTELLKKNKTTSYEHGKSSNNSNLHWLELLFISLKSEFEFTVFGCFIESPLWLYQFDIRIFFFIEKPLTRGLCLLNFPQSPLLKIVNLASLLFPIPPGCPRVLSQEKADDHDMCIRQPFSLIIIFQAHLVIFMSYNSY